MATQNNQQNDQKPLKIGSLFSGSRYRIDAILAQDEFGITYQATEMETEERVAIKEFFPKEYASRNSFGYVEANIPDVFNKMKQRFLDDIANFIRLNDNYKTIKVIDQPIMENGTLYMVTQFPPGESLEQWFQKNPHPGEDELLKIISPILDGINSLYEKGLAYLEITQNNIYICDDGPPILWDFDTSRKTVNVLITTRPSTPSKHSGDAWRNDEYGPWIDIHALGAVLYRGIMGEMPISPDQRKAALKKRFGCDPLFSACEKEKACEEYSSHFIHAIEHALQLEVVDRPQSIEEWQCELTGKPLPHNQLKSPIHLQEKLENLFMKAKTNKLAIAQHWLQLL